jgi:dipeptidyl aminopeptidase/acylaminoacyl peptidase
MKKIIAFSLLNIFSIVCNAADFNELTVQRLDGTDIQYYLTTPSSKEPVPLLLVLQGSSCTSAYDSASSSSGSADKFNMARLDVEKYGLNKDKKHKDPCPQSYLNNNTLDQRISDYLRVMQILRGKPWWNRQLIIIGGSEGAVLTPILASYIPETSKIVIMAGNTAWSIRESWLFLQEKELRAEGLDQKSIQTKLNVINDTFNEAQQNPTSNKNYFGETNTYKWWSSILEIRPLNFMLDLEFPILIVHGDLDSATPVENARATVEAFKNKSKNNLTYIEYPGLEHSWKDASGQDQSKKVYAYIFSWISKN